MQHIITKFGGTSVSSRESWNNIAEITKRHINNGFQPIIVCSALTQASNKLEKMIAAALLDGQQSLLQTVRHDYTHLANTLDIDAGLIHAELAKLEEWLTGIALLKEAPAKTQAQILSLGELMMTKLGHAFLQKSGINCHWLDARDALISHPVAGGERVNYLAARCIDKPNPEFSHQLLNNGAQAVITQGFIAANDKGDTVLLGRGGSDTSAALFAALVNAKACEIWTDVPGIYTANPHQIPNARLLKQLNYEETQEVASMGAKVLHPNCIPPVKRAGIPLFVKYTRLPTHSGTRICRESDANAPLIKSIQVKHNVTLISIDTLNMWQQVGFLSEVFNAFKTHEFSVDLLSSSEFNVTLSLDTNASLQDRNKLKALLADLNEFGRARLIEPCSAVSLVGHNIRTQLPKLGSTFELFESQQVYLMSLASNDLNITFVVEEAQAERLCQKLHALLIEHNPHNFYYSKSWQEEFGTPEVKETPWWHTKHQKLVAIGEKHSPCYVYNTDFVAQQAAKLKNLQAIDQLFYAIKANSHPAILKTLWRQGIRFECVSQNELQHVLSLFPEMPPQNLLFTPNFSNREEYEYALKIGCHVTIDNLYPLQHWPEIFQDQTILLRIDPGCGAGHHKYVSTGGNESKFGIPKDDIAAVLSLLKKHRIKVTGLHAHSGSGILTPDLWQETALMLADIAEQFPDVNLLNLGGGLGIVEKPGQKPLDLAKLDASLQAVKSRYPQFKFWLEPGRYYVAESGVILAKVTQCKEKGKTSFIGIETGMNSLLRPALYGSYHDIVNLSRLDEDKQKIAHIVGPICESGDTLGYGRLLPDTQEKDILLIANTGAYGYCMSSSYNLRPPAQELILADLE